jgi:hypothetical protein
MAGAHMGGAIGLRQTQVKIIPLFEISRIRRRNVLSCPVDRWLNQANLSVILQQETQVDWSGYRGVR